MDVKPTCQVIYEMAETMRQYAAELETIANKMDRSVDLEYASDALQAIKNMNANLRTDLLVTRPIREYQKIINLRE